MIDYKDFGFRVRALRRRQEMTQEELAEKIGVSTSFVGHIERGSRNVSLDTLCMLCNVLGTSPQHLLHSGLADANPQDMPLILTEEKRRKLSEFLRIADDVLRSWDEE